jgi:hypothetical protein
MTTATIITTRVNFTRAAHGRRRLNEDAGLQVPARPAGRVPRVARLLALALRLDAQVRSGALSNYSTVAELARVSRARVSQIVNLVNLAPDIQETILFLPRTERGRDPIYLRLLQPIASANNWKKQRRLWHDLLAARRVALNCDGDECTGASQERCGHVPASPEQPT